MDTDSQRQAESFRKNSEGYSDPTAYQAVRNAVRDLDHWNDRRVPQLINCIKHMANLAGFEIEDRIILKDIATGRIWR